MKGTQVYWRADQVGLRKVGLHEIIVTFQSDLQKILEDSCAVDVFEGGCVNCSRDVENKVVSDFHSFESDLQESRRHL